MEEMLNEVQYCQKIIETKFKKQLKMSDNDEKHFNALRYQNSMSQRGANY